MRKKKIVVGIIIGLIILFMSNLIINVVAIKSYLNKYGFSANELPKTIAVYYHLNKGFTVKEFEDGQTLFIGSHNNIYGKLLEKKGYHFIYQEGNSLGYENESGDVIRLFLSNDWCHYFRVYTMNAKVEDII